MILLCKEEKTEKKEALFSCIKNVCRTSHQLRLVLFGGLILLPGQIHQSNGHRRRASNIHMDPWSCCKVLVIFYFYSWGLSFELGVFIFIFYEP
jgi:hypothetical protein